MNLVDPLTPPRLDIGWIPRRQRLASCGTVPTSLAMPILSRTRMEDDGYLFFAWFFPARKTCLAARKVIVDRLAAEGFVATGHRPDGCGDPAGGATARSDSDLTTANEPSAPVCSITGVIMEFYREFFGEPIRHYDCPLAPRHGPGNGTRPSLRCGLHGPGARGRNLLTAWVPARIRAATFSGVGMARGLAPQT